MATQGLRTFNSYAGPEPVGETWRLQKSGRVLRCELLTHALGWELKVWEGAELARSQVCKTQDHVFDQSAAWKAEAITKGWTEPS